ncbi:hypothetical protein [Nocardia vulneris]|uniref:hypothetical protein n=1 Tax=Nocardia vulneris TaxID=1141657 RepID=UPI0005B774B7|nr:hypothetical protein [Nocardia vulneris]
MARSLAAKGAAWGGDGYGSTFADGPQGYLAAQRNLFAGIGSTAETIDSYAAGQYRAAELLAVWIEATTAALGELVHGPESLTQLADILEQVADSADALGTATTPQPTPNHAPRPHPAAPRPDAQATSALADSTSKIPYTPRYFAVSPIPEFTTATPPDDSIWNVPKGYPEPTPTSEPMPPTPGSTPTPMPRPHPQPEQTPPTPAPNPGSCRGQS